MHIATYMLSTSQMQYASHCTQHGHDCQCRMLSSLGQLTQAPEVSASWGCACISYHCKPKPRREMPTVQGPLLQGLALATGGWLAQTTTCFASCWAPWVLGQTLLSTAAAHALRSACYCCCDWYASPQLRCCCTLLPVCCLRWLLLLLPPSLPAEQGSALGAAPAAWTRGCT